MVLLPYLLTLYYRDVYVRPIYMSSYADIPMGILFGAGIGGLFCCRKKRPLRFCSAPSFAVTAESISKDMGFALCLIAAALVCFDLLFLERGEVRLAALRGVPAKLGWCALMVGLPTAAFFGWAAHLSSALSVSRFDLGGSGQMGMAEMVITGHRRAVWIWPQRKIRAGHGGYVERLLTLPALRCSAADWWLW